MATPTYKVLGQLAAASGNAGETLYTVPAGKSAVISTIAICNRGTTAATYRIAIRVAGATLGNAQYLAYDALIPPTTPDGLTYGITLGAGDIITVASVSTANVTFQVFGSETAV